MYERECERKKVWEKESEIEESEIEECQRECVLGSVSEREGEYEREIRERVCESQRGVCESQRGVCERV